MFVRGVVYEDALVSENSSAIVPDEVVGMLVESFRRHNGGGTRRHIGLGLSIVAAVARAHVWDLAITARDSGGLVVRIDVETPQEG